MKDQLGDRMKRAEAVTNTVLPRRTNTIIRVDGKAFHTFTKSLNKPYDSTLGNTLCDTMKNVANDMQGCVLAYRQSDEISFLLQDFAEIGTEPWFGGKVQKMASVAASMTTAQFNRLYTWLGDATRTSMALFDARVFTIPDRIEAANYFLWRNKDAYRNALSMYFQATMGHKWCQGRSTKELAGTLRKEEYECLPKSYWNGECYNVKLNETFVPHANFAHWESALYETLPGSVAGNTAGSESVFGSSNLPPATNIRDDYSNGGC